VLSGNHPKEHLQDLERALKAWSALPEAEHRPEAFLVPDPGPLDPRRNTAKGPPPGTLIVRVYNRQLERTKNGDYRHTVPEDYIAPLRDPKIMGTDGVTALFTQPANDSLWITRAEAQAMMPAHATVGQRVEAPRSLCERIFRFHLDPSRGLSENNNFAGTSADAGKLHLTVEAVGTTAVRLRLEGFANLHSSRAGLLTYQSPGVRNLSQNRRIPLDYNPRLLGYLVYRPTKRVFTRLDIVALGDVRGRPNGENILAERIGEANPLGIAFELVTDPTPANLLPPRGARDEPSARPDQNLVKRYLGLR
jgi:hypothetical protein